jgi:hypothetical protein
MIGCLLAAPAIIRTPGLLMPVRPAHPKVSLIIKGFDQFGREVVERFELRQFQPYARWVEVHPAQYLAAA